MLRTIWFYFWFVLGVLVCGVTVALAGWLKWDRGVRWVSRIWGWGGILPSGAHVEADLSALPQGREFVILANHQSYLDIYLLFSLLSGPYRIAFVAKDSLFRIPVLGMAMRHSGHVAIDRSNQRKAMKSIDKAVERSRQGATVVIFPEGTRGTDPSQLGEFQIGGMILALKCGLPVVPIVHHGTFAILPQNRNSIGPPPRTIRVKALPLIETQGKYTLKDREQFRKDLYTIMNDAYLELHHESQ